MSIAEAQGFMGITAKHVRAVLRNEKLKELLLLPSKELTLEDYKNYDNLNEEKLDIANENIIDAMEGYAPFSAYYPSPVEHLPDDAVIYGTKGFYFCTNQDGRVYFSNKKEALRYASEMSKTSWDDARAEGLV